MVGIHETVDLVSSQVTFSMVRTVLRTGRLFCKTDNKSESQGPGSSKSSSTKGSPVSTC